MKINNYFDNILVATYESSDRISKLKRELNGVDYDLVYGADASKFSDDFYQDYWNNRKPKSHGLKKGMLGCTLTHIEVWKKIYENKLNNTLVLEDDILVTSNIHYIGEYMKQLPENWDILYLGMSNTHSDYDKILKPNMGNNIYVMTNKNYINVEGTNAYVIRDHNIAGELVRFNKENLYTSDGALMEYHKKFNCTYCFFIPQLIRQNENITTTSNKW